MFKLSALVLKCDQMPADTAATITGSRARHGSNVPLHVVQWHSFRAFLTEGRCLQTIRQLGKWLQDPMFKSYLQMFNVPGLLAIADWPEAAQGNMSMFWRPRFHMKVSASLSFST